MKAKMKGKTLAGALKKAGMAIDGKAMGTLNGFHVNFRSNGKSFVAGLSAECQIRALFDAEVDSDFDAVVSREFFEVTNRLQDKELEVFMETDKLKIQAGRTTAWVQILSIVPAQIKSAYGTGGIQISGLAAAVLGIRHALPNASCGNSLMASVKLNVSSEGTRAEALDGVRIAVRGDSADGTENVLIPGGVMKMVASLFREDVVMEWNDSIVTFSDESTILDCGQTAGTYFDTSRMLSSAGFRTRVTIDREELAKAIDLVMVMHDERRVWIRVCTDNMEVWTASSRGCVNTSVDAFVERTGDMKDVLMNGVFLLDALKSVEDDRVALEFMGEKNPIILKGEGYTELMLPCNPDAKK